MFRLFLQKQLHKPVTVNKIRRIATWILDKRKGKQTGIAFATIVLLVGVGKIKYNPKIN